VLGAAVNGRPADPHPNGVLVGLALYDDDREFVEGWCIRLGKSAPDPELRGLAGLCIGHLLRRFRQVSVDAAALVEALVADPDVVAAAPQVLDGQDDLRRSPS
jgi:hypothetical protein